MGSLSFNVTTMSGASTSSSRVSVGRIVEKRLSDFEIQDTSFDDDHISDIEDRKKT